MRAVYVVISEMLAMFVATLPTKFVERRLSSSHENTRSKAMLAPDVKRRRVRCAGTPASSIV